MLPAACLIALLLATSARGGEEPLTPGASTLRWRPKGQSAVLVAKQPFIEVNPRPAPRTTQAILVPKPATSQEPTPAKPRTASERPATAQAKADSLADRMARSLGKPEGKPKVLPAQAVATDAKQPSVAERISSKSSRSRVRNSIMQVSDYKLPEAKPLEVELAAQPASPPADADPFGAPLPFDTTPPEPPPADATPLSPDPSPLGDAPPSVPSDGLRPLDTPADELYKDDPIPEPPDQDLAPFPDDLSGPGLATDPGGVGCTDMKGQCTRALAELQKRDITTIVVGIEIEGVEGTDYPCDCKIGRDFEAPQYAGRNFQPTLFTWKAAGTCHKPLYFQDVPLERYGHSWNPILQPFVSGAHFFVSVPLLPYKMGLRPPGECVYTLGYYRPGNCAPYMLEPIPLSLRGALFEAAGATAFAFWFWPPN